MHQLVPEPNEPEVFALRGLAPSSLPLAGNAAAWDGTTVTAGFSQWEDNDHFAVFENRDLADIYRGFLSTAAEGNPTLAVPE
jgi:hypothetical protein